VQSESVQTSEGSPVNKKLVESTFYFQTLHT